MNGNLQSAMATIDWNKNVTEFLGEKSVVQSLERGCMLVSVWNYELSFQNSGNEALPFLQERKASCFHVVGCLAVGLYKSAASSMRAAVENALYFSFFRHHSTELKTLVDKSRWYISKSKIVEYHSLHTPHFQSREEIVGFLAELDSWYSEISAIIHGQIPGVWTTPALAQTSFSLPLLTATIREFNRATSLINHLFLLTVDEEEWESFSSKGRSIFLKGMSKTKRRELVRAVI